MCILKLLLRDNVFVIIDNYIVLNRCFYEKW